ncbi:MAG TPA: hypothetical protein VHZ51_01770 [Ktedonobacteraceae bacterium]|jgi:hypothetical protein|nr:hypothetical protein [Ktedonobacteraceae bacterium]
MKLLNDRETMRPSRPTGTDEENRESRSGVVGNKRLTALAGVVLLVLILVELVSTANLYALLPLHIFVGVLLAGPLVVKLGSTGYRFLRYYTKSPAYVRSGPPRLPLRLLAPLLLVTTLLVVGSGIGLVVTGPAQAGLFLPLHSLSVVLWLSLIAIHVVAYLGQALRWVADDWRKHPSRSLAPGRGLRLGVTLGALLAGAVAALLLLPGATPWVVLNQVGQKISGALIEGLALAIVVLLVARPLRWR